MVGVWYIMKKHWLANDLLGRCTVPPVHAREKAQASDGLQQQLNDKSQELPNAFFALAQQAQAHVGTANQKKKAVQESE